MPALHNIKHEAFCQAVSHGNSATQAYVIAGYKHSPSNACNLRKLDNVTARIDELIQRRALKLDHIEDRAIALTVERMALSKEKVITELARLGFANIVDYIDERGIPDLSKLNRDTGAAVTEVHVEHYVESQGDGEPGREVRKIRFKLADKRAALVDIGKELGMFIDRKHIDMRIEDRLAAMTPAQREEDARQLAERLRAQIERYKVIEGDVTETVVEDSDTPSEPIDER